MDAIDPGQRTKILQRRRALTIEAVPWISLPNDADPEPRDVLQTLAPVFHLFGVRNQIRNVSRHGVQTGPQVTRHTQKRGKNMRLGHSAIFVDDLIDALTSAEELPQVFRASQG